MSNRHKERFTIKFKKRKGHFWKAEEQPYKNCEFSAGIVTGLEPDTIYMRIDGDNRKPITIVLRPDEALAIQYVLAGAIWSKQIQELKKKTKK